MAANGRPLIDISEPVYPRAMTDGDRDAVERIYEDRWGEFHDGVFDEVFDDSRDLGLVAVRDGTVRGFLTLWIRGPDAIEHEFRGHIDCSMAEELAYIQMLCVDRRHESNGVGSILLQAAIQYAAGFDSVDYLTAVCWRRTGHYDSVPLFEKWGFRHVETIDEFYWDADDMRTSCPDCDGICTCPGSVYTLPMEGS